MDIVNLIKKKKQGKSHTKEEICFIIDSIYNKTISDAQISAWLMAVCFKRLNLEEISYLAEAIADSGNKVDFGELGFKVIDKHSTGGVGDKVTITLMPLLAAAGVAFSKIADRGIGYAAGTIDKFESIPGFKTDYSTIAIVNQVKNIKAIIASQDCDIAPVDKRIYTLRNMTSTADSEELIALSILSKKIASGADNILVDVKYGSGSFMKTPEEAASLSNLIVKVGKKLNKSVTAVVTAMEEPLGRAIGNSIEIIEAIEFLKGNIQDSDLAYLTYYFASLILINLGLSNDITSAKEFLTEIVKSGKGIEKFKEIISAQGGDPNIVNSYDKFELPSYKVECASKKNGFIQNINAFDIARAARVLGAIRENDCSKIDYSVGIYLNKKSGEYVTRGETIYTIYSNDDELTKLAQQYCDNAFLINESKPSQKSLVYKVIGNEEEDV